MSEFDIKIRRYEEIRKLELKPRDVLQIVLGGDVGDGGMPWIPAPEDIDQARVEWEKVIPEGVNLIVTHFLVEPTIIRPPDDE